MFISFGCSGLAFCAVWLRLVGLGLWWVIDFCGLGLFIADCLVLVLGSLYVAELAWLV